MTGKQLKARDKVTSYSPEKEDKVGGSKVTL